MIGKTEAFPVRAARWHFVLLAVAALVALTGAARAATHTLKVKVTDQKGRALPMANVEARQGRGAPTRFWAGADGIVPLKLRAGTYLLTARAGGHMPGNLGNVRVPQQKTAKISLRSHIKPGMGAVTFLVQGGNGKPLTGATVQFVGPGGVVQRSTYNTDPYALTDIPAGSYKYAAYARGHQQRCGSVTVPQGLTSLTVRLARARPAGSCRATINFFDISTAKPLSGVELTYGYRTKFSKTVTVNRSTTVGPFKPGIYWARAWKRGYKKTNPTLNLEAASMSRDVYLTPETNNNVMVWLTCKDSRSGAPVGSVVTIKGPGINKTARTSGNPSFFGAGTAGKWLVTATAPGYRSYRKEWTVVKRGPTTTIAVRLEKAASGVSAGAKKHYATFVFTDARTRARLSGVSYTVSGPGTNLRGSANGQVRVGPLSGGLHVFSFEKSGYQKTAMRSNVGSSGTIPIQLTRKGDSVAVAAAKNMLAITPTPSTGGSPITGAQVIVQGPSGRKVKTISSKNIAAVFYDLAPGTYTYTVTAAGYSTFTARIKMGSSSRETKILKMKPGALVVSVLVVDERNSPVSRATVQAMGPGGKSERTVTDRAGQARLKLFTGVWGVTASAKDLQGASQRVTVPVRGVPRFVLKYPRGGLGFTVTSSVGLRPVSGAKVAISSSRGGFKGVTDSRGTCRLTNVPQGTYTYTITASGYRAASNRYTLRSTATMAVPVKLQPLSNDLMVTVLDAKTRKPVAGANLAVRVGSAYERKVTDAAGRAALTGLKVSSCTVYARKTGYAQVTGTWRATQGGNLTLMLARPPLGVRVLSEAGRPIPGASVTAYWNYRSGFLKRSKSRNATVQTDAAGQCWVPVSTSIRMVRSVLIKANGYESLGRSNVRVPAELQFKLRKIIPPSQRKVTLTVKVLDSTTRRPLSGAAVNIESGTHRKSITVASTGVALFRDVPWGRCRVRASKSGYSGKYSDVTLDRSGDKSVDFQLTKRRPLFVFTVLDSAGKPVSGARLSLQWRERGTRTYRYKYDRGESDAKGQVLLYNANTRDGRALVTVVKDGLPARKRYLGRVYGNSPCKQTVRLAPAAGKTGTLQVTVTDSRTRAKIGGALASGTAGGKTYSATTAPGTGIAVIKGIPLNTRYNYTVAKSGYTTANTGVTLTGDIKTGVALRPAVVNLTVIVLGTGRRPVPGAVVSVFWGDARSGKTLSRRAVTAANGRATFSDTPRTLPLSLSVSARGYKPRMQQVGRGAGNAHVQLSR